MSSQEQRVLDPGMLAALSPTALAGILLLASGSFGADAAPGLLPMAAAALFTALAMAGGGAPRFALPGVIPSLVRVPAGGTPRRGPPAFATTISPVEPRISIMDITTADGCVDDLDIPSNPEIDGWLEPERLPINWIEASGTRRESAAAALGRRIFDIVISAGLLLVTLPVLILTAVAIRIETRGPIFYRQERVGRDGHVFTLFKFRSMTVDAEAHGGAVWAVPQDPRVTRVGRFIRLTRIDEVPQVLNVLRGEMAFIGPRPERPVFVAQLERAIPHYADRAAVKPGITGWAQVRYRYGASVEDARMKLGYDLYYVQHRSLALDLRILAGTVRVVLLQEGAR